GGHDLTHSRYHRRLVLVVHIALQELQHLEPVARIDDERGEEHVEAVVDADELVPVESAPPDGGLELPKRLAIEGPLLQRLQDVAMGKSRAVQRNAHARRKDRVDEAS